MAPSPKILAVRSSVLSASDEEGPFPAHSSVGRVPSVIGPRRCYPAGLRIIKQREGHAQTRWAGAPLPSLERGTGDGRSMAED